MLLPGANFTILPKHATEFVHFKTGTGAGKNRGFDMNGARVSLSNTPSVRGSLLCYVRVWGPSLVVLISFSDLDQLFTRYCTFPLFCNLLYNSHSSNSAFNFIHEMTRHCTNSVAICHVVELPQSSSHYDSCYHLILEYCFS